MLYLFERKIFFEKYFLYFWCSVLPKMMVKGNHFQFNQKSFFKYWEMIYSFKNRKSSSEFKFFILATTFVGIHYCGTLKFIGIPNLLLKVLEFWDSITEIRPVRRKLSRHPRIRPPSPNSDDPSSGKLVGIRINIEIPKILNSDDFLV
jgi:hypothetical protein